MKSPMIRFLLAAMLASVGVAPASAGVQGRVVLDENRNGAADAAEPGLAGVSVSDGFTAVKTDSKGAYRLAPSRLAVFIQIVRPSGRDVIGSWYKPVAPVVDFCLSPKTTSEEEYTFIQVTDTHVSANPRTLTGVSRFVEEVNSLAPLPRFVINSGDLVNLDKQLKMSDSDGRRFFDNYAGLMNKLRIPYYNVAGDHTDSGYRLKDFPIGDPRRGKAMFWEYFGPNHFSFEYGRVHFISVDTTYHMDKTTHTLIPEHLGWLEQDMANRSPGSVVVTASEKTLALAMTGLADWGKKYDIALQLVGDDHIVSYKDRPIPTCTGGSLSGTWWNGPCADLSPQGYMIYRVSGTSLDCFYKGLGQRVAMVSPSYGSEVKGTVTFRAHIVSPAPADALSYSVDGTTWKPMRKAARPFYRAVYEATWDSTSSPDGLIELRVKNTNGGEMRSSTLVVHNGSASAKFGSDASLTFILGRVIAATNPPKGPVDVLMNGATIGEIKPALQKEYVFNVPSALLTTVNVLTFHFAKPGDGMTITHPFLTLAGRSYEDPHAAATRKVRLGHWPADIVKLSGWIVGDGIDEGSFALKQNVFFFVTAPKESGTAPSEARRVP